VIVTIRCRGTRTSVPLEQDDGSGGDFAAALLDCVENDGLDEQANDGDLPAPDSGFFYVVRGLGLCDEAGTYDAGGPGQVGARDAGIAAAAGTCP
jgi:hypothetical protein